MNMNQSKAKGASISWDFAIQTDWKIKGKRLDIVVKDYKRKLMCQCQQIITKNIIKQVNTKTWKKNLKNYGILKVPPCE